MRMILVISLVKIIKRLEVLYRQLILSKKFVMIKNIADIEELLEIAKKRGWIDEDYFDDANDLVQEMQDEQPSAILKELQAKQYLDERQIEELRFLLFLQKGAEDEANNIKREVLFSLDYINKSYKTPEGKYRVLKDVTMDIYKGEILAILGFSGSGKSTLLNILGLLTDADEGSAIKYGEIKYDDLSIKQKDTLRKKDFGFIFQESHLLNHLTVVENVALPLRLQKKSHGECLRLASKMMRRFMTKDEKQQGDSFLTKKPGQLSGGQKQRVAAARAMVHKPRVIFADEPTGGLDFETGRLVMNALLEVAKDKEYRTTVILVTHNHSEARQYCKRFVWMEGGVLRTHIDERMKSTIQLRSKLLGASLPDKASKKLKNKDLQ